ncbi:MAG: hypothetical protein ABI768_05210 [Acidobacteriota bacterium]
MRVRGLVLALCLASAAGARAQEPDWFDAFRDRAFLQGDASFIAREKTAPPESSPLFRARWVVVRYRGFSEKEREFWPYRNLLLVTMPSGSRYVLESSYGFRDEKHLDEERPFDRLASERTALEIWMSGTAGETGADAGPCEGSRVRVRAPGGSLDFFLTELSSRTVRATLAEITAATFDEGERRDLVVLLRMSIESNRSLGGDVMTSNVQLRQPLLAIFVAFRDEAPPVEKRTLAFAPDPAPPGDLAAWRGLAHLPLDLPLFPATVPENPIR